MNKKAQSEVITTVLLVLIALAAIAIIAVFIVNQVKSSTSRVESSSQCINAAVQITSAVKTTSSVVVMNTGQTTGGTVKVTVNGVLYGTVAMPGALETASVTGSTALAVNDKVEAGVVLADGTPCAGKDLRVVTA